MRGSGRVCGAGRAPKKGSVALPGFWRHTLGSGAIMWPPVSVCGGRGSAEVSVGVVQGSRLCKRAASGQCVRHGGRRRTCHHVSTTGHRPSPTTSWYLARHVGERGEVGAGRFSTPLLYRGPTLYDAGGPLPPLPHTRRRRRRRRAHQRHASGLMGSPTLPRMRRLSRLCSLTNSSPARMRLRMAVGAV